MTLIYTGDEGKRIRIAAHELFFMFKARSLVYLAVNTALSCNAVESIDD